MTSEEFKDGLVTGLKLIGIFSILRLVMIDSGVTFIGVPIFDPILGALDTFIKTKLLGI